MRYTDYLSLVKPRNPDFSDYVNRRINEGLVGCDSSLSFGMKEITKQRFGKLFIDMAQLENELEKQRKYKIQQVSPQDLFRAIDVDIKGFCTLHDYFVFFEGFVPKELPVSTEEITYLFKRHDRQRQGRVTEADLTWELTPIAYE